MTINLDLGEEEELDDYSIKCQRVLDWADENSERDFDTSFTEDILLQIEDEKYITKNQKIAIDRIIKSFDIT